MICPRCKLPISGGIIPEGGLVGSDLGLGSMSVEPIFILRAQDISAPALVQLWISLNPQVSAEKRHSAEVILRDMQNWRDKKPAD